MKPALILAIALLAGCGQQTQQACIGGVIYEKYPNETVWQMKDGAPAHTGFTPIPCKLDPNE
jgi:hypothetical protein